MTLTVTVVDYGLGNLFSVSRALMQVGAEMRLVDSQQGILDARCVILPGVGAFQDGMKGLHDRGLVTPLRRFAASGRPFLGICLGMQMLFESSEEFGNCEGLGLVSGRVVRIPGHGADGTPHKIPHIGWNELRLSAGRRDWNDTLLMAVEPRAAMYFVHSYACEPAAPEVRLADCDYHGCVLSAAVQKDTLAGVQFHPEKSGRAGLQVLKSFIASAQN